MNVIDEIEAIVVRESASDSSEWLSVRIQMAIEQLPDVDASRTNPRWCEYEIDVSTQDAIEDEVAILEWLRPLEIAAAPEIAAIIPYGHDGRILVRRYWACAGERLVPAESLTGPFDPVAAARFRHEMAKLAELGKVHDYARGIAHWFIGERTHTIVMNAWLVLEDASPSECEDVLASIDFELARRS